LFDDAFSTGGTTLFAMAKGARDRQRQQDVISQSLTFLLAAVRRAGYGVLFSGTVSGWPPGFTGRR
jgi:Na+-driven multidrug efflux pump